MSTQPRDPVSWSDLLQNVQADFPDLYRTWFDELEPGQVEGGELRIRVVDPARARYLREQCNSAFTDTAMGLSGFMIPIRVICPNESATLADSSRNGDILSQLPLNADYTFEEFVVGPSNRLAHAACKGVCGQPGRLYNPLFIHGHSGLGKSHLLQATCAELRNSEPPLNVLYVSCETFVNDYIRAMGNSQLQALRDITRRADVLVIDDIQFLAARESQQEELFHTFNVLHQSRRQLVLSADSLPSEIPTLQDRLISRFKWGLVTEIAPPNRETREAILHRKAQLRGCAVPNDVIGFIAEHVAANIRLLEGALTRLITESQITGKPLNLQLARETLEGYSGPAQRALQVSEILNVVSEYFDIRVAELLGRKRSRSISHPRQVAMYLARTLTPLSLEEIGVHFGGRNHATVLHAERQIENDAQSDEQLAQVLKKLSRQLLSRA